MKKCYLLFITTLLCSSCAQKVYFFDAQKLGMDTPKHEKEIVVNSYFAGDALDYVIFELDVENNSQETIDFSYRDVYLEIYEKFNSRPIILDALNKDDVIAELEETHERLKREKRARDIGNALDLGINLALMGSVGGSSSLNAILYSTDVASVMMEDARAYKFMTGSLEEQINYIEEWVIYKENLKTWGFRIMGYSFSATAF